MAGRSVVWAAPAERLPEPSGEATVVLDIGEGRGALVVYLTSECEGTEVEIRPVGEPWTGTHTAVRRRNVRDGSCFAAVFGTLAVGNYHLRTRGSDCEAVLDVAVGAGRVSEASWPTVTEASWPTGLASVPAGPVDVPHHHHSDGRGLSPTIT